MNLTLTQSFHRTQDLSGEIKAAQSALADCEADHAAKERIASIAGEAVETAKANLARLEQEREDLAVHMAELVRCVGATTPEDRHTFEVEHFEAEKAAVLAGEALPLAGYNSFVDFGHPLQNGDDSKVNAAYERAVTP